MASCNRPTHTELEIKEATLKDPAPWLPYLQAKLDPSESIITWLGGDFSDAPKSMRTGLLALTDERLLFFRKKLLGEEFIAFHLRDVACAGVGVWGGIVGPEGGVPELTVDLHKGGELRMVFIQHGDHEAFAAAIEQAAPNPD